MIGEYRFYEDGRLIAASRNLITNEGKKVVRRFFASGGGSIGTSLAVGVGATAAAVTDYRLDFEVGRANVSSVGSDTDNNRLVFKATLPRDLSGTFYEAGLFNGVIPAIGGSKQILGFTSLEPWSVTANSPLNSRFGTEGLLLNPATSGTSTATLTTTAVSLADYSNNDEFGLAFFVADANAASVVVRLGSDATNYYTRTITAPAAGYQIARFKKTDFVATGTPFWSNIAWAQVAVTAKAAGATAVYLDGLRIDDVDSLTNGLILVSRSVLATPIAKTALKTMDVEYAIGLTV